MKKLLTLLFIIPLFSIGQNQGTYISSRTVEENELVLSEKSSVIKTPLTADLSNYTHLLIVHAEDSGAWHLYALVENLLSLTAFEIMNPKKVDKKRFRKDAKFLKTMKNESYLYLYVVTVGGRGDDQNTSFIIRDWKNKIIYNATHINTGLNEVLAPLIDY